MSALDQLLVRFIKEEIHPTFQELYVNNFPEKWVVSEKWKKIEIGDNQCTNSNRSLS